MFAHTPSTSEPVRLVISVYCIPSLMFMNSRIPDGGGSSGGSLDGGSGGGGSNGGSSAGGSGGAGSRDGTSGAGSRVGFHPRNPSPTGLASACDIILYVHGALILRFI